MKLTLKILLFSLKSFDHLNIVIWSCFNLIFQKHAIACITGLKTNKLLREALKIDLDGSSERVLTNIIIFTKVT